MQLPVPFALLIVKSKYRAYSSHNLTQSVSIRFVSCQIVCTRRDWTHSIVTLQHHSLSLMSSALDHLVTSAVYWYTYWLNITKNGCIFLLNYTVFGIEAVLLHSEHKSAESFVNELYSIQLSDIIIRMYTVTSVYGHEF